MTTFRTLLVAAATAGLLVGPVAIGCGGDDEHADDNQQADDGQQEDELEFEAAHVVVDASPTRHAYDPGASLSTSATVYAEMWEELDDIDVDWSADPGEAVDGDSGDWTIEDGGTITFEACAVEHGETTDVCATHDIIASGDAEGIVIESPSPGDQIDGAESDAISVEGYVNIGHDVQSLHVNGDHAAVDDDGNFSYKMTPEFGVNTIEVRAFDGIDDEDHTASVSVLWAPGFQEVDLDDGISASFNDGLLLTLGQNFLDDGEPYTEISESEILTEDLADILRLVLERVDVTSQIPDPVVDSDALMLQIPDVHLGEPNVELVSTNEGIELFGQIPQLRAETQGFIQISDETIDLEGHLDAIVSLFATLEIEKGSADDDFEVDLGEFELALEETDPNFEDDEANAVFEVADSVLRDQLEEVLLESVDLSFIDVLPDTLVEMLEGLEEAIAEQQFDIALAGGDPLQVDFNGQIEQFTPIAGEGLTGYISAETTIDADPVYPDTPGIPLLEPEAVESPLFAESRVQIALDFAVLNNIFYSLWNAGLLGIDVTDLDAPIIDNLIAEGHAEGLLPPVISPPTRGEPYDVMLDIGQLELELDWLDQPEHDRYGTSISIGADLNVVGELITIDLADEPEVDVWIIETSEDEPFMTKNETRALIKSAVWSDIEDEIGDNIGFGLPLPELDVLEPFAPELADMQLGVRMNRSPDIRNGYLVIDATLEGEHFLD